MILEMNEPDCREFQQRFADEIASGHELYPYPHLQKCEDCRALFLDLQRIAHSVAQGGYHGRK